MEQENQKIEEISTNTIEQSVLDDSILEEEPQKLERISLKTIGQSILDNFNINKGVLKTLKLLTIEPGKAIRTYFFEDRKHLIKSFRLLIATTALATIATFIVMPVAMEVSEHQDRTLSGGVMQGFNMKMQEDIDAGKITQKEADERTDKLSEALAKIEKAFNQYFNVIMLLFVPLISWMTYFFFRSAKYNYAEHLVLNAYVSSYSNILFLLLSPFVFLGMHQSFFFVYLFFSVSYSFYVYYKTFETTFVDTFFKGLGALFLAYMLYYIVMGITFFLAIRVLYTN